MLWFRPRLGRDEGRLQRMTVIIDEPALEKRGPRTETAPPRHMKTILKNVQETVMGENTMTND